MVDDLSAATRALADGRLIVYPTDTLYGLGASATDRWAVRRLLEAKERPSGMPISIAVSSLEELEPLVVWSNEARALARRILPGSVTLLIRASPSARRRLAPSLFAPDGTLGVRVPDHPVAREIARRAGPITATSANVHGAPAARTLAAARRAFGNRVGAYVGRGPPPTGRPSTLVDLRGRAPRFVERR